MKEYKRVVITGIGAVSPVGFNCETMWKSLKAGRSGIKKISVFDTDEFSSKVAGEIKLGTNSGELDVSNIISPKEQTRLDKYVLFAMAATDEALNDSNWHPESDQDRERTGVLLGSGIGGMQSIFDNVVNVLEKGYSRMSPFFIPKSIINMGSGNLSIKYGLKGPNLSVVTACATGTHAIGEATRLIMHGDADVMVAGGSEAALCAVGFSGFCALRALSTSFNDEPEKASRPWDKARDGFVMGEGAGILILEELEHAKARGAKIYAEVVGYGLSGDAFHITAPEESGNGAYRAMLNAINDADIKPEQIDYINAHGTSTPLGDLSEFKAVKNLFGENKNISMSSTKSMTGHLLGAAGAVEAIICALSIRDGIVPPTINLDNPEEITAGFDLVPNKAKNKNVDYAISNSFGFGGTNASLVLKKYSE